METKLLSFGNAKCLVFSGQQFIEGRDSCVSYLHKEEYLGDICQGSVLDREAEGPGSWSFSRCKGWAGESSVDF